MRAGGRLVGYHASPRYPPILMLAAVPLTLLPFPVAAVLFFAVSIGAVVGAMWLLGVRDWRCIAIATISSPAAFGSWVGNVSTLLLLGCAITWRLRDRDALQPVATAFVIGAKLFLWPLAAWYLATRRYRKFALTAVLTVVVVLGSWAVIGFAGLASYPKLLMNVAYIGELRGSSLVTALLQVGLSVFAARALALAFTAVLIGAAWKLAPSPGGEERAFGLVVVAALVASPVVWLHSLVLLFVPVALLSPRLSLLWFVPAFASATPIIDIALELTVIAVLCAPLFQRSAMTDASSSPASHAGRRVRSVRVV